MDLMSFCFTKLSLHFFLLQKMAMIFFCLTDLHLDKMDFITLYSITLHAAFFSSSRSHPISTWKLILSFVIQPNCVHFWTSIPSTCKESSLNIVMNTDMIMLPHTLMENDNKFPHAGYFWWRKFPEKHWIVISKKKFKGQDFINN